MPRPGRWPGALLLPFTLAFCGDSFRLGNGCDEDPSTRAEVPASGTITLGGPGGPAVSATGTMTRWDGIGATRAWSLSLGGTDGAQPPAVRVGLGASTPYLSGDQAEVRLGAPSGDGQASATAVTTLGGYVALASWPGAEGLVRFQSLDPPHGTAHFVLVPGAIEPGVAPGAEGTTLVLDATF